MGRYALTPTARNQIRYAFQETRSQWGLQQAKKYRHALLSGLQNLADNHQSLRTSYREKLAEGTSFSIHLIEHRYAAFQEYDANTIIIAGIFHESMDIPARLKELQDMTRNEISTLKRELTAAQNH
jgi:plasmid stabilization system protein ParE